MTPCTGNQSDYDYERPIMSDERPLNFVRQLFL